jgi:hypothetical protein
LTGWESQNTLDLYLAIVAGLVLIGVAATAIIGVTIGSYLALRDEVAGSY